MKNKIYKCLILTQELIKHIIYDLFTISDEIILLNKDIIFLDKYSLFELINICYDPFKININQSFHNIDILYPEYNEYLQLNINNLYRMPLIKASDKYISLIIKCVEKLYSLNNDIFDILFKRYCDQKDSTEYIKKYKKNLKFYISRMKISEKIFIVYQN
jgi:hypothetical protein